jgi:hypothetical protein
VFVPQNCEYPSLNFLSAAIALPMNGDVKTDAPSTDAPSNVENFNTSRLLTVIPTSLCKGIFFSEPPFGSPDRSVLEAAAPYLTAMTPASCLKAGTVRAWRLDPPIGNYPYALAPIRI